MNKSEFKEVIIKLNLNKIIVFNNSYCITKAVV